MEKTIIKGPDGLEFNVLSQCRYDKAMLVYLYWSYHPRFRFLKTLPSDAKLLDVGAGPGGIYYFKQSGLPVRDDMKLYAIDVSKGVRFDKYDGYQLCDLNREDIKYEENSFDAVLMSHVLEHLNDEIKTMQQINRVLKNDGRVYIEVPTPETLNYPPRERFLDSGINTSTINFFDDHSHVKTYSMDELITLLKTNGFTILESGIIDNQYLEDELFTHGWFNNDQETTTYSLWSKLKFAQYVVGQKLRGD